jgi:hypothetical protein
LNFFEERENLYKAYYTPTKQGLEQVMGHSVAVNYKEEYKHLGLNPNLERIAQITGGKMLPLDSFAIITEIESQTRLESTQVIDLSWVFLLAAIVLYLIEIIARKVYEIKTSRNY